MTFLPLAVLLTAAVSAAPRPTSGGDPQPPAKIDAGKLSAQARALYESDPAGFEREHGDDLETVKRWSQDPSLGQAECLSAKKEPRACMESRLAELREVAKPEELAVIQSYVKLLPRGVSAPLPAGGSERSASAAPGAGPSAAPAPSLAGFSFGAPAAAPGPTRASDFRAGPNSVSFSAVPAASLSSSPSPQPPTWWEDQYNLYMCFYVPSRCPK
ncbi:hypothetical protein EPO15_10900 [bacterium]|nr:MAG: hypothetical protein EPO15_10900 [bacterium]